MAAAALTATDITDMDIDTVRSGNADGWYYRVDGVDDVTNFGLIYDNANTFVDDSAGSAVALKIGVVADSDTIAIQDFDFLTITGAGGNLADVSPLVVWLPALAGADELFIDTDGNTWLEAALTTPAGGVLTPSDTFTPADADRIATEFLDDALTPADSINSTWELELSLAEAIAVDEGFTLKLVTLTIYLKEELDCTDGLTLLKDIRTIYLRENVFVEESTVESIGEDFSEDSQTNFNWVEV